MNTWDPSKFNFSKKIIFNNKILKFCRAIKPLKNIWISYNSKSEFGKVFCVLIPTLKFYNFSFVLVFRHSTKFRPDYFLN